MRDPNVDLTLRDVAKEVYTKGALFPGSPVGVQAPSSFFDPLTGSLMTEPVKLVNTNETFDRTSLQSWYRRSTKDVEPKCPRTGQVLRGWIIIQADEELRRRIVAWADKHKCNLDLISRVSASQECRLRPSTLQPAEGAMLVPTQKDFLWNLDSVHLRTVSSKPHYGSCSCTTAYAHAAQGMVCTFMGSYS